MSGQEKVYVIDPVDQKAGTKVPSSSVEDEKELPEYLQPSRKNRGKVRRTSRARTKDKQSGVSLILSYLAGPLSVLATGRGRRSRFWAGLAVFSVALTAGVMLIWGKLSCWSTRESPLGAIVMLVAIAAVISGFSAWTRAVVLAGSHEGPRLRRSPDWIRGPLAAGLFGFICPGMGLFAIGRSKHAVAALWMACVTVISLLFLSRVEWLWNFNAYAGVFAVRQDTLEYILTGISAATALGGLAWIVQALNGARLAGRASNRKTGSRRDWAAAALLLSIIALLAFSRPAVVAEALDRGAAAASSKGMRIIPLHLSLAAIRLDPSRPGYVIRAIGLYEDSGDQARADAMRRDLMDRLEASVPFMEYEGVVISKNGALYKALTNSAPQGLQAAEGPGTRAIPAELLILDWGISRAIP
ncbi:MAG: hypothetical protein JW814_06900 [Candidatus Krumholzibacteriota bacterium]|nr:hypothetical protein [Candidatus Krumholzibacteriota bacterium]